MPAFIRVPPDGTGKKLATHEYTDVNGDDVHVQVMHVADHHDHANTLAIDNRGSASFRFSEGQPTVSGFGKLNVSNERVLGVYESSSGSYDELYSITLVGGASNQYDDIAHSMVTIVDGANGSHVSRRTNRYHYYLPGSANLIKMTVACGDTGKIGNIRRWGAFDVEDGVFFELNGTTLRAVIRNSTTGTVVDTGVIQDDWNGDKIDGTGLSGMTVYINKINVWWIDYQWLGAGRVRFGVFAPDGSRLVCHTFENAGQFTLPYMRTGTLPLATENLNVQATGSPSMLREVCLSIYTEGTHEDYTFWRSSDLDVTNTTVGAAETLLLGIRSKILAPNLNHHNSVVVYPETLNIHTTQPVRIDIIQHVELTGGTWTVASPEVSIEGSVDTVLNTSNKPFKTFFFPAGTHTVDLNKFFELNDEGILLRADDTQDPWVITGRRLGASDAVVTLNLGYKELW